MKGISKLWILLIGPGLHWTESKSGACSVYSSQVGLKSSKWKLDAKHTNVLSYWNFKQILKFIKIDNSKQYILQKAAILYYQALKVNINSIVIAYYTQYMYTLKWK